ncbi:hypothetical protein ERX46_01710 [Brumimicrobium glaciale]|uniref:Uncharacterized protein n=1 Tax=Brumimicrobium glaciale TaxID=200475 RepID=A0A4Q4KQH9_9FLAO|nr:hypothetical protein [Brumimicrobium glaciale]RYM35736.1 hypothetical protein ERX46_01710 [Brumimicrobium glaciale]
MKTIILTLVIILNSIFIIAQNKNQLELENWIKSNGIEFNKTTREIGFEPFTDCKNRPAYRKVIGDTIIVRSWGGSVAENLETFKKTALAPDFYIKKYATKVQKNATVVVSFLVDDIFIWRNDTLYLFDTSNLEKSRESITLMEKKWRKEINEGKYEKELKKLERKEYGFVPKFKAIYYSGIFEDKNGYRFLEHENFREELVLLIKRGNENGKEVIHFQLITHTNGWYRISTDLSQLENTRCQY